MSSSICPQCGGRGSVVDADPYADRSQWITCRACGGSGWMRGRGDIAFVMRYHKFLMGESSEPSPADFGIDERKAQTLANQCKIEHQHMAARRALKTN